MKENFENHLEIIGQSIAHDLRTPLLAVHSGIEGVKKYLPVLIDTYKQAAQHQLNLPDIQPRHFDMLEKALNFASQATYCANVYVNILELNLTRINIGNLIELCSMSDCLDKAIEKYPYKSDRERLILSKSITHSEDFLFNGNKVYINNLLLNLFSNSVYRAQRTENGTISIITKKGKNENYLYIKDTDIGLPSNELESVFLPTYRSQQHNLGLYFCKELMRVLKGDITCHAEENCFTEFILTFPSHIS
ncbi:MAG TPA: ATP-binding protein [Patescibacteria group bacterium]|nr:ATP-binding protein [Gammaproteobacteria bacterium]HWA51452.1 ATP-binding protein [Patescibacteria group bacterium]